MKITITRRKSNKKPKKRNNTNMATKHKKKKSKSKGSKSGVFSGKILGQEIPIISKVMRNKTFQKVAAGAGTVSIALSIAALLNNAAINKAVSMKPVRIALAAAGGDLIGAGAQFVKEGGVGGLRTSVSGTTSNSSVGFA